MSLRNQISDLHRSGLAPATIARELRVAPTTVDYHLTRLEAGQPEPLDGGSDREGLDGSAAASASARANAAFGDDPAHDSATEDAKGRGCTRARVAALLGAGFSKAQIARELGLSKATISYHVRRIGAEVEVAAGRRYDWSEVQRFYDEGHSVRDCMAHFGFAWQTWFEAVRRGAVRARPSGTPLSELLVAGVHRGRFNLKARLVREGIKSGCCERCGLTQWRGEPISLALHHVNGVRDDNRLENIELLCPNCHSQTDNFGGRNGGARRPER